MAFKVASASDYQSLLKQNNKNAQGISEWERMFLQPLQEEYSQATKAVQKQTSYDISGAYANYKKQQMNIMQNQQLGTGFKEQIVSDLKSAYDVEYAEAKAAESQKLSKISQSHSSQIAESEKSLLETGEKLSALEREIYNFAGITDLSKLATSTEAKGGLGYFDIVNGRYEITERGRDFFDRVLNAKYGEGEKAQFFTDYLSKNKPELYDFLSDNKEIVNELVGGLSKSDVAYTDDDRLRVKASDAENAFAVKYPELYDKSKSFKTQQERLDYYDKRLDEQYTKERQEAYQKTTTRYDYDTLYKDIGVGPAFRWSYDGRETLNKNIQADIENISGIKGVETKTIIGDFNERDFSLDTQYYHTTVKIPIKSLTPRQLALLNKVGGKEGVSGFLNLYKSGKIEFELYATPDKNKKRLDNLTKRTNAMTYEEFFKLLGS